MNFANAFNAHLLTRCSPTRSLHRIYDQYRQRSHTVLDAVLPYEPTPPPARQPPFQAQSDTSPLVIVAHCIRSRRTDHQKVTLASGFALRALSPHPQSLNESENVVLTCAHTLEHIHATAMFSSGNEDELESATVVVSRVCGKIHLSEPSRVLSSIPKSDLLLLSVPGPRIPALPVSPYPATVGTNVDIHLVTEHSPPLLSDLRADPRSKTSTGAHAGEGPGTNTVTNTTLNGNTNVNTSIWRPWLVDGAFWSCWRSGRVMGYRDHAGREAQTGTYDELAHLLFDQLPTPGSSGGPIVDCETGAVVGVVRGTRMDSRVEGLRGWGTPAEAIFEMFSLPGLNKF